VDSLLDGDSFELSVPRPAGERKRGQRRAQLVPRESRHTFPSQLSSPAANYLHYPKVVMRDEEHMTGHGIVACAGSGCSRRKELTRRSDDMARRVRILPWVRVRQEYRFGPLKECLAATSFGGRSQLLVDHFMFGRRLHGELSVLSGESRMLPTAFAVHLANPLM